MATPSYEELLAQEGLPSYDEVLDGEDANLRKERWLEKGLTVCLGLMVAFLLASAAVAGNSAAAMCTAVVCLVLFWFGNRITYAITRQSHLMEAHFRLLLIGLRKMDLERKAEGR